MNIPFNRAKIIATVGPAISDYDVLRQMIIAGVNTFRVNFSHGEHEQHKAIVDMVASLNQELGTNVGLLADLQGPKIRIGMVAEGGIQLEDGSEITITTDQCESTHERLCISYERFAGDVNPGDRILIDDGNIDLEVLETDAVSNVRTRVIHGGRLTSRKGVNLPNTRISVGSLTEKDKHDLRFILEHDFQWIALSFVRRADDVRELKGIIGYHGKDIRIISKIERPEALAVIDQIIDASDAIMIARGDLGVEVPLEQIPGIQKSITRQCVRKAKPVIIATQMMESMITNSRPTRAEITDVANAVIDGADAVMLSAETSVGKFPVKTVQTMARIVSHAEGDMELYDKANKPDPASPTYLSDAICATACKLAKNVGAGAIMGMTRSGYTAYTVAANRPRARIFIFTDNPQVIRKLSLVWGVHAYYYDRFVGTDSTIREVQQILVKDGKLHRDEVVINLGSMPLADRGKTNMLKVSVIQ